MRSCVLFLVLIIGIFRSAAEPIPAERKEALLRAIEPLHAAYDPAEQMLREPFRSPGYHTTLKSGWTHPTRSSINYALACLDTGDPELLKRAEAIILKVISLQDQDPGSPTYGIWSWFLEEPLKQMSPPDWNWADFIGTALVQIARDHRHRLSPETVQKVKEATLHACRSIQKRNVGPGYTNIAIMGSYVSLIAGELYDWPEVLAYAVSRWRQFYEYTRDLGTFNEYNSPTYTIVALREIARLRAHVRDGESRRMADEIYRLAWEDVALHYHVPSGQWSGPHSRAYRNLLTDETYAFLEQATRGASGFRNLHLGMPEVRVPQTCPPEFTEYFFEITKPREVKRTYARGSPGVIGTTYLTPVFSLGSASIADLWNQRRPLVAYWGTRDAPAWFRVRFLHDDYDFSAAQFYSVQKEGRVLAAIAFATDGGDTHVSLDRLKNGVFNARDLRLRFEFGGDAAGAALKAPAGIPGFAQMDFGKLKLGISVQQAVLGDLKPRWETGQTEDTGWIDLVFYSGDKREFDLSQIAAAGIGLAVEASSGTPSGPGVVAETGGNALIQKWSDLRLRTPLKSSTVGGLKKEVN